MQQTIKTVCSRYCVPRTVQQSFYQPLSTREHREINRLTKMKTLRLIGMAIIAIIMGANFLACSDDDDNNNEVNTINPQHVFPNGIPKQIADMKITQNTQGLITKIETEDGTAVFEYPNTVTRAELANQHVKMTVTKDTGMERDEIFIFDMEIGNNGFIKHSDETEEDGDFETWDFEYTTEGNLKTLKRSEGGNETTTITYENGNITEIYTASKDEPTVSSTYKIDYTSNTVKSPIENKGGIMLYDQTLGIDMDEMDFAYYAGLLGKATKNLPLKLTYVSDVFNDIREFTWTLNANGLPTTLLLIEPAHSTSKEITFIW